MINTTKTFKYGDLSFKIDPKKDSVVVKIGDVKTTMRKHDIWQMAFLITKESEQDDLITLKKTHMMRFVKNCQRRLTKDMKAGEAVVFNVDIDVPTLIVESLLQENGKELKDVLKKEDIVIPSAIDA